MSVLLAFAVGVVVGAYVTTRARPDQQPHVLLTLTPHHGTEGLREIVEGYKKLLRDIADHLSEEE